MSTAITISKYVKEKLDKIKEKENHKSYDSVVRRLLSQREFLYHKETVKALEEHFEKMIRECLECPKRGDCDREIKEFSKCVKEKGLLREKR